MQNLFSKKWARVGFVILGILFIGLAIRFVWFVFHLPPETRVEIGLIKLSDTKYKSCREMPCFWEMEGIIKQDILLQDKEISVPILLKTLKNKEEESHLKTKIIDILKDKNYLNLSQQDLYPHLLPIIKDKTDDSEVRARALIALKGFRIQELVDLEMEIAGDKNENEITRSAAIVNLGETKEKQAVDLLIRLLEDESEDVNISAVHSLGEIGDEKILPYFSPLLKMVKEKDCCFLLQGAIENAIEKINNK